jgi:hypothetical protein
MDYVVLFTPGTEALAEAHGPFDAEAAAEGHLENLRTSIQGEGFVTHLKTAETHTTAAPTLQVHGWAELPEAVVLPDYGTEITHEVHEIEDSKPGRIVAHVGHEDDARAIAEALNQHGGRYRQAP